MSTPTEFAGQNVIVVGGGTSAVGFLLELEQTAAHLTWVSRRDVDFLEGTELNMEAGTEAVAKQDEAARAGRALPSIVSGTGVPRTRTNPGRNRPRPAFTEADVHIDRARRSALGEWILRTGGCDRLGDRVSSGTAPPRSAQAAREGRRSGRCRRVILEGPTHLLRRATDPQASTIGANRAGRLIARQVIAALSKL